MLTVSVEGHQLQFRDPSRPKAGLVGIGFQRTLRIPDDGKTYPLPPGLGNFPVFQVRDYATKLPASWVEHGGVFIPMSQAEAMWISIQGRSWRPNAIKVAVGKVNAISGNSWSQDLQAARGETQDYLVAPPQPWLDGINAGPGTIRQFVAMPLGLGVTVEAQVTGEETVGGLQLLVFESKPGRFPDEAPPPPKYEHLRMATTGAFPAMPAAAPAGREMGLAAGGQMKQKIYPDPHGIDTWDQTNYGRVFVHIVNSLAFKEITGQEPPPSPISAETYTQYGLPWFDLYDDAMGDVAAPEKLKKVKSLGQILGNFFGGKPIDVPDQQVKKLPVNPPGEVDDGKW